MAIDEHNAEIEKALLSFLKNVRHGALLGLALEKITEDGLIVKLPYSDKIIGNPVTGVIHGGAITTLMDQSCGMAVLRMLAPDYDITPTIDLRIDYMKPAQPNKDVYAHVTAYRKTQSVVFTRGVAYQDDPSRPIAHCVANFMRMGLRNVSWQTEKTEAHS